MVTKVPIGSANRRNAGSESPPCRRSGHRGVYHVNEGLAAKIQIRATANIESIGDD
jgi:hypothetical protein